MKRSFGEGPMLENLENAVRLARDWKTQAAEPEINARRAMNRVTMTIDDVTAFIEQGIGKQYMQNMRAILADFVAEEEALIVVRNEEQSSTSTTTIIITLGGALLALLIGVLYRCF